MSHGYAVRDLLSSLISHCRGLKQWLPEMAMENGIIFISPDYRLLLPSTGYDQIEDVQSLFNYLASHMTDSLPEGITIDTSHIAVAGVSAGAYLARLACLYAEPRPRAFLSLYGMGGDWFLDHWVATKDTQLELVGYLVSQEDVSHLETSTPISEDPATFHPETGRLEDPLDRVKLFPWWWQNGEYIDNLMGERGLSTHLRSLPYAERAGAILADVARLFPQLNIDSNFPPTILIHGDKDTEVLLEESTHTHEQLKAVGVVTELYTVQGADHGLMVKGPQVGLAPQAQGLYKQAFDFLEKHIS